MRKDLPSPDLLRKILRYEPDTGKLFWRERSVDMFTDGKHDAERACAAWNGKNSGNLALTADGHGYKHGTILGRDYLAHRVIWAMMHDEWPDTIDHINGVRDDNRISNLRSVSQAENLKNQKRNSRNKSGVCGVHWHKRDSKWEVQIRVNGKTKNLGRFCDLDAAITVRKEAEAEYGYHENHGRV